MDMVIIGRNRGLERRVVGWLGEGIRGTFAVSRLIPAGRWALLVLAGWIILSPLRPALAQISPGPLARAHESLEGLNNCTKCHTLGKEISNTKCLECHKEIQSRVTANTGYHASVKTRQCVECHKEHFGRTFSLVRLDTRTFDHSSTGYTLAGKHRVLECRKCHKKEMIRAEDILKNPAVVGTDTYLGLATTCNSCHENIHRSQLPNTCDKCHSSDAWSPAVRFDHNTARYVLTGKHIEVKCNACHKRTLDSGKTIQFVGLKFASCSECHGDPHRGKFRRSCESCHATGGWNEGIAKNFDHSATQFPLRGKHTTVPCAKCHGGSTQKNIPVTADRFHVARFRHCADCHADAHNGEFARRADGGACQSCHTEDGFTPSNFVHATAKFVLRGRHADVKCAKCHEASISKGGAKQLVWFKVAKFTRCADCHADAHAGQFSKRSDHGACESCHDENTYSPSLFTVERHQTADFTLSGAHAAVSCMDCHRLGMVEGKRTRVYHWKEQVTCQTCHRDIHLGEVDRVMQNGCATCHNPDTWKSVTWTAHDRTKFPLTGKHAGVACGKCHKVIDVGTRRERIQFQGVPARCVDCHGSAMS